MLKNIFTIAIALFITSCTTTSKKEGVSTIDSPSIIVDRVQSIPIHLDGDDYFNHLEEYLTATSYVKLAPEPLLTEIKGIRIYNERIYIWDRAEQIVCYDMQGNVTYRISSIGNGPGEYSGIRAFAINPDKAELVIYDNLRISLLY